MRVFMCIVGLAVGIFSLCGAIYDWDFFMNDYKAQFFVKLFGRNGARIFYGALGGFIILMSLLALMEFLF